MALVEGQPVMRSALGSLLAHAHGMAVALICASGAQLLDLGAGVQPDVIIGDPRDFGTAFPGLVALVQAGAAHLLLYTQREQDDDVIDALMTVADGHVSRRSDPDVLVDGIRAVARGERYVDELTMTAMGRATFASRRQATRLTPREGEILSLLADGHSARQVGASLYISEGTVKTHINQIYRKLDVKTRGAAVAYALRAGLVS